MSSDAPFLFRRTDNPHKYYPIPENKRVRLRSLGVLGTHNDRILARIATCVGARNLHVLRMAGDLAVVSATVGDSIEEALVSLAFLVPNDLSVEDERKGDKENGAITRGYAIIPPQPSPPDDQQMIAPPKSSS